MKSFLIVGLMAAAGAVQAQHQPDAGEQGRDIKGLSAKVIELYRAGARMGYAKAAELNHYPGPMHALELADRLELSLEQRTAAKQLMDEHKTEARAIGAKLVEAEHTLEALFRSGKVEQGPLAKAVHEAAALQGEYRVSHLETHRRMRALLSDGQVARYYELRSYAKPAVAEDAHQYCRCRYRQGDRHRRGDGKRGRDAGEG